MKLVTILSLFTVSTLWAVQPTIQVGRSLELDGITNHLEEVKTPEEFFFQNWDDPLDPIPIPEDFDLPLPLPGPIGGGNETLVIVDQIINLGEKIWNFIAKNKPVLTIARAYANALPTGIKSSEELSGFSPLKYRSYRMHGTNPYGITVYDVTYTLVHRFGGNYNGKGAYVEHATVLPHKVEALWGYTVEAGVEKVGTANVGTREAPVGSLVMETWFRVSTIIKVSEFRPIYEFRGDSERVTTINNDQSDSRGERPETIQHHAE